MAGRPPKKGIDYSGWSVTVFDNDTKIDKLLDAQGWIGFGIYFYLCQRAYGSEGYFYKWGYDDCASTSRKMGGGIGAGTVKETVDYCLQIGLFDKGLFDRWGVLTSRGIQRRYWEVVKARDVRAVISDYWLLQENECKGLLKIPLNTDFQGGKANFQTGNTNNTSGKDNSQPIKESKVNKSNKDTIRRFTPPSVEEVNAYCKSRGNGINGNEFVDFYSAKGWMIGKNRMKDWKAAVRTWEQRRKDQPPVKKGSFNDIQQNNYDFGKLEEELRSN